MPLGSLIGVEAAGRIQGLIKDAVAKGARVVAGGKVDGTLMSATVIDHVNSARPIATARPNASSRFNAKFSPNNSTGTARNE